MRKIIFTMMSILFIVGFISLSSAYKIEFSKYGLVDPAKASTGRDDTSPFDAEWNSSTKVTDIWLTDMDGGYNGRRVFNWQLDESSGGQVWSYMGGFTTTDASGIRALNIKSETELLIAHENGTIATYDRNVAGSHLDVLAPNSTFNIGGFPHHMGFDGSLIWTNTNGGAAPNQQVKAYDLSGTLVKDITTVATYIEGIAREGDHLYVYNAGESVYSGHPSDGREGWILKYDLNGNYVDDFQYESGDRPPFHSEALSWDGGHFWMAGFTDGKVYRMEAEEGEGLPTEPIPEPTTMCLMGFGILGLLGFGIRQRRKK